MWEESDFVRVLRCAVAAEPGVPWLQHVLETTIGDGFEDLEDMAPSTAKNTGHLMRDQEVIFLIASSHCTKECFCQCF